MVTLEMKNVTKIYDKVENVKILDDINFKLNIGDCAAIVGPSGSGKSTMLNLVGALDKPTSGEVVLANCDITNATPKELANIRLNNVGFIFQSYNLIPVLTVAENVEYVMLLQGIAKEERKFRVMQVLENVGLLNYAKRRPLDLSGGQQQRVAVARAIAAKPAIVLADEPTANLDHKTALEVFDLFMQLNKYENITFLFSTHDPVLMKKVGIVYEMRDGKLY